MKKFFARRKLKKSKSVQISGDKPNDDCILNGGTDLTAAAVAEATASAGAAARNGTPDRSTFSASRELTSNDDYLSSFCATSSSVGDGCHIDKELDKHVMQIISDVKYVKKRPKFVAVGEINFQRECLDAHNAIRAYYGCQALVWSQELSDLAHSWAKKLADRGRILFPELPGIGENIRLTIVGNENHLPSGPEVTDIWAQEVQNFDFDNPRWSPKTQHFTQIVWKETFQMGTARCWNTEKNCVAIVAFYRPSGNSNAPGEFEINIPSKPSLDEIPVSTNTPLRCIASALHRSAAAQERFSSGRPSHSSVGRSS